MELSQLTPGILQQAIASLTPEQLEALGLRRPATDREAAAYEREHAAGGAPADFSGPVFSNPAAVHVSDDTDSGIDPMQLPTGVTLQKQNFTGPMPGDVSNPAAARLAAPSMQTIAAHSSPLTPDRFMAQQNATQTSSSEGAALTPDRFMAQQNATPATETKTIDQPGWLDREIPLTSHWNATLSGLQSVGRGVRDAVVGMGDLFKAPQTDLEKKIGTVNAGALPIYRMLTGLGHTAKDSLQAIDAIHDINASADPASAYAKMAQEMAGQGAGQALVALATEGLVRGMPKTADTLTNPTKMTAPVRALVKGTNTVLKKAPGSIGASVGAAAGGTLGGHLGAEIGAGAGYALGRELLPQLEVPGEHFGLPKRVEGGPEAAPAFQPSSTPPEVPNASPSPAQALETEEFEGVTSPPHELAAEILNKPGTPAELEQRLNEALGGKPLQRGVSLRNQGKAAAAPSLPEGFTPVESSVLKGYKYDPAAREFDSITSDGRHYIHGDVNPEDAQAFEAADSKGKAWQQIRNNPLVAKVLNGKRVPVQTAGMQGNTGELIPKAKTGMQTPLEQKVENLSDFIRTKPDEALATPAKKRATPASPKKPAQPTLLDQLQQSLDQVKGTKGGVFASAKPAELLDRWGVDPESFAEGRAQTRGMSAEESEAAIDKLAKAYKRGQAIEPVMETRDAANNLIEVDGRNRALAAHRAGIERIPVIVRRVQ